LEQWRRRPHAGQGGGVGLCHRRRWCVKLARGQNGAWMAAAQGRGGCKRRRCSGEDGCGRRRTVAVRRGARISNTVLSRASCRARTLEKAHNYSPRCFGFIDSSQPTSAAIHLSSPMRFVLRGDETGGVAGLAQTRPAVLMSRKVARTAAEGGREREEFCNSLRRKKS
jgi:hypothetical protein